MGEEEYRKGKKMKSNSLTNDKIKNAIERFKEVRGLLGHISTREEAIKYLIEETKLSEKECSDAYDILMKLDLTSNE